MLTSLAHGGGCGCKLPPSTLREILAATPAFANLLVGPDTTDDAAIWRLNDQQALVATTDFFTPIVDDPHDFGRIAATNALSDVYAMGGTPIFALAILGIPTGRLPLPMVRAILEGGAATCAAAGIPIAGGHSIDSPEPIYGLAAIGLVHPDRVLRNSGARAGDALILSKGLGIGIFGAALKRGVLSADDYATMLGSATRLNAIGAELAGHQAVHAATDVTGFGLIGHTLEICRASGLAGRLDASAIPLLPGAAALARRGLRTGAGGRNWESDAQAVQLDPDLPDWQHAMLVDPQTSGGLLIAVAPAAAGEIVAMLQRAGFAQAAVIGEMVEGVGVFVR